MEVSFVSNLSSLNASRLRKLVYDNSNDFKLYFLKLTFFLLVLEVLTSWVTFIYIKFYVVLLCIVKFEKSSVRVCIAKTTVFWLKNMNFHVKWIVVLRGLVLDIRFALLLLDINIGHHTLSHTTICRDVIYSWNWVSGQILHLPIELARYWFYRVPMQKHLASIIDFAL